jgi:ubiquinone/menaquinone biosynthesis C-methylase UbiE
MSKFHNRTRSAPSIPAKLWRTGKPYLIPVYYLMLTSELAREGINNSGSYRFADHIYAGIPKGRMGIGWLLDAVLLRLKSATSLRARYLFAKEEILRAINEKHATQVDVLAVPCGLARELFEIAEDLSDDTPTRKEQVRFYGVDLDDELIDKLEDRAQDTQHNITFVSGDALSHEVYDREFDVILSTGFTEFLPDEQVIAFFRLAKGNLKPGGKLITTALQRHRLSDYLLRNIADLQTNYRSEDELRALIDAAGFDHVSSHQDKNRLQTMLVAS